MDPAIILYAIILILLSFIPPIFFLRWFRNLEKFSKEPYSAIFGVFLWGAFVGTFFAAVINYSIYQVLSYEYIKPDVLPFSTFVIVALIVAPVVEEAVKPLGVVTRAKKETDEVEDGMIYGAAAGLGFAATENLIYGAAALGLEGIETASALIIVRTLSSTLLHASATAITGYGIGLYLVRKKSFTTVLPYFLIAVLLHALFNAIAMTATFLGFLFAVGIAIGATEFVKRKIMELDQRMAHLEVVRRIKKRVKE